MDVVIFKTQKMQFLYKHYLHFYSNLKNLIIRLGLKKSNGISWNKILKDKKEIILKQHIKNFKNKKILIATNTGGQNFATEVECLFSLALYLKGYEVEFLLCDGSMNACLIAQHNTISEDEIINSGMKKICSTCLSYGKRAFSETGFKINYYSDLHSKDYSNKVKTMIKDLSFEEMKSFCYEGVEIGLHSYGNLIRYYAAANIEINEKSTAILRNFIFSSIITKKVTENLLNKNNFERILLHHAIYVPQGIVADVALKKKIDYVSWTVSYKKECIQIAKNNNPPAKKITETKSPWINKVLTTKNKLELTRHFEEKKNSTTDDWINFLGVTKNSELSDFIKKNNLGDRSKNVVMYTNIIWDAQFTFPDTLFKSMIDWMYSTIDYFHKRPDLNLIIRVHPAETNQGYETNETVQDCLKKKYKILQKNIFVIENTSKINSYKLADHSALNLVYTSSISYELSAIGHNVMVAGSAFVVNKEVTIDPKTKNEYFNLLERMPHNLAKISTERKNNALKYAHYFQNTISIKISSFKSTPNIWPPFEFDSNLIENLIIEKDDGIKYVIDHITE